MTRKKRFHTFRKYKRKKVGEKEGIAWIPRGSHASREGRVGLSDPRRGIEGEPVVLDGFELIGHPMGTVGARNNCPQ